MSSIRDFLQQRLAAGEWRLGEVLVRSDFSMRHQADAACRGLRVFHRPEDAREIAKYDAKGQYRPLKAAPNLSRGWLIALSSLEELRLALDFLYPAALGNWAAFTHGALAAIFLRDTLNRQTGMYRVAQLITDAQACEVIEKTCVVGCIRYRLWRVDGVENRKSKIENSEVLCPEACNLLIAACRPVAKRNLPASSSPA